MEIITLGTSHGDPNLTRFNTSTAILLDSGELLLIDAGTPTLALMIRRKMNLANLTRVFITHCHEDHIGGLPDLLKNQTKYHSQGNGLDVYLPETTAEAPIRAFNDISHRPLAENIRFHGIAEGVFCETPNYTIRAIPTNHCSNEGRDFPSYAFVLQAEGKTVLFTGDLSWDFHDFPSGVKADLAFCELTHYHLQNAIPTLKKQTFGKLVFYHVWDSWDTPAGRNTFQTLIRDLPYPCEITEDGNVYTLEKDVVRVAVLADLHITDNVTVKHDVLKKLVRAIPENKVNFIVTIGDMTATGTQAQNHTIQDFLRKTALPYASTPGNAEIRLSAEGAKAQNVPVPPNVPIFFVNTMTDVPDEADLQKLAQLPENANLLLATHVPPQCWNPAAKDILQSAVDRHAIGAIIGGHLHQDDGETLRGLDPDKASGGCPEFDIFEKSKGKWTRSSVPLPGFDFRQWDHDEKEWFLNRFGISAMYEPFENFKFAIERKIPVMEMHAIPENYRELFPMLEQWREVGGHTLSIHLAELYPDNNEALHRDILRALELHCDRVTLHVPRVTATEFPQKAEVLQQEFLKHCDILLKNGVTIGIENLHTTPPKRTDDKRNFGCTITECRNWIETLRDLTGERQKIGFHLDIGHARNNAPFSANENLSDYYALMGPMVNGIHLHQVSVNPDGSFENHTMLTDFYGKLIALGGFFAAWQQGMFPQYPPMFLEIRGLGKPAENYDLLMKKLME